MSDKGIKHDQEKVQLELLSAEWIEEVGKVLTFGARKYAAHNWRNGLKRSRLLGACLRHVFAYLRGEDYDPETGLLHLAHASCCLMFACELHYTMPDTDDRYRRSGGIKEGVKISRSFGVSETKEHTHHKDPIATCYQCFLEGYPKF